MTTFFPVDTHLTSVLEGDMAAIQMEQVSDARVQWSVWQRKKPRSSACRQRYLNPSYAG